MKRALCAALFLGLLISCTQKEKKQRPGREKEIAVPQEAATWTPAPSGAAAEECPVAEHGGMRSAPAPEGEEPSRGGVLLWRMEAEPGTLNPLTATDLYEQVINSFILESLLSTDIKTGELEPGLAESWEVADDKVTFTFHMRKNATFHDGHPVTADDVIYTLDRIMDPKVDAPVLRSYYSGMESYEKLDDFTVRIKWKEPYFLALEFVGGVQALPRHILDDGTDFNTHPFGRRPVGSGPYRFVEWETGRKIRIERYEDYWGEEPYLDGIYWKIITEEEVALRVLKKGELDFIRRVPPSLWIRQNSKSFLQKFNKLYYDYPTYNYIGWNMRKPMFADKRVRQALTMLLNRPVIRKEVYHCLATIADGPFYPKFGYSDPSIEPWPYDPGRAKELLAEAGWKDTDGDGVLDREGEPFRFELSFTSGVPEWERLAVIYQQDLKKAGIDMKIRTFEWATFLQNVSQWKFDASALSWALPSKPDPYQVWHSSQADIVGSSNHVGYKNEEVDRLIELNRREFDEEKRKEYCRKIHRVLHEEQPYTFVMVRMELSVLDKRVRGVIPYPIRPVFEFDKWYIPETLRKH